MQLIAADVLAEARGLSLPLAAGGVALGALLWSLGWRYHRFWVVLATTVAAGLTGLSGHAAIGPRMLAAGLLLAIAAGLLAIDLSRLLTFAAGGAGLWLAVHKVLPNFHEPTICFLLGGVLGLILYRLQMMLLTSLTGALLFGHSLLLFCETLREPRFAAADWSSRHVLGLNIVMILLALGGVAVQGQIERWREGAGARRSWWATFFSEPESSPERNHLPRPTGKKKGLMALFQRR